MAVRKSVKFEQVESAVCAMVAHMESAGVVFPTADLPEGQLDLSGAYNAAVVARGGVDLEDPAHKKDKTAADKAIKAAATEFGKAKKSALLAKLKADAAIDLDGSPAKIEQAMIKHQTAYTNALIDGKDAEQKATLEARAALRKLGNLLDSAAWAAFLEKLSATSSTGSLTAGKLADNFFVKPFSDSPAMVWDGTKNTLYLNHADEVHTMALQNVTSRSALNKVAWRLSRQVTNGGDVQKSVQSAVDIAALGAKSIAGIDCRLGVAGLTVLSEMPEWVPTD